MEKKSLLKKPIEHIDIKIFDARPIIDAYASMAFQARNLSVAAEIYDRMLSDHDCKIILTLAGTLFSAGLKHVVADMIDHDMVDVIVSTGAVIIPKLSDFLRIRICKNRRHTRGYVEEFCEAFMRKRSVQIE
ncbi:MAG: deoxyhypusine synthase family protein [Deltaproteobacteria bacterium]|nr:deoxyhypusine synthase family protein [Deltaproteobacteria bacterium]